MDILWLDGYMMAKTGATKDFKVEWQWDRYMIGGKMFAAICSHKDGRKIITLKCEPAMGEVLRHNHRDIIEGYYMNKVHWNSVYLDGAVTEDIIKSMIDMSYSLVLASLPKSKKI